MSAGQPFANRFSRFRRRDSSGGGEVRGESSSGTDGHVQSVGERCKSSSLPLASFLIPKSIRDACRSRFLHALQVEQVAQLATFSEGLLEYHQQCTEILRGLTEILLEKYVIENHDNCNVYRTEYLALKPNFYVFALSVHCPAQMSKQPLIRGRFKTRYFACIRIFNYYDQFLE